MTDAITAAEAFNKIYRTKNNMSMREFRMHKLLYFAQKEHLRIYEEPLFADAFQGWRYGPVLPVIHAAYRNSDPFSGQESGIALPPQEQELINGIYRKYENVSDWELNSLTQEEFSWLQARQGLQPEDNGQKEISLAAIKMDILKDRVNRAFEEHIK